MEQIARRHDAMGQLSSPSATAAGEASFAGPLLRLGLTISFFGEIPVIGGNGIPFRNSGEFRRISVNFGRIFLNFEFSKRNFPKIPKYFFPVLSGNEKFRRNFKP